MIVAATTERVSGQDMVLGADKSSIPRPMCCAIFVFTLTACPAGEEGNPS